MIHSQTRKCYRILIPNTRKVVVKRIFKIRIKYKNYRLEEGKAMTYVAPILLLIRWKLVKIGNFDFSFVDYDLQCVNFFSVPCLTISNVEHVFSTK